MGAFLCRAAFKEPTVHIKMIRPKSVSRLGSTLVIHFSIHNPNSFVLDVKDLAYKIVKSSDGTQFAEGRLANPFSVPPDSSVNAQAEVSLSFSGLGSVGKSLLRRGKTAYRASGTITVGTRGGPMNFPYRSEGEFAMFDGKTLPQVGSGK